MFEGPLTESILFSAQKKELVKINIINLRDFATDKHRSCDDSPYGGGAGMILRVDIIDRALEQIRNSSSLSFRAQPRNPLTMERDPSTPSTVGRDDKKKTILLTPRGKTYDQKMARKLSKLNELTLICGHYEGVDERVAKLVDEEISIGDYVLTGGEIAAMAIVDSVTRLIPGVIKKESLAEESFGFKNCKEYPQYTRPEVYKNMKVPKILLSGDHQKIKKWRLENSS